MLAGDVIDPEVAFLLGKDTNTFRDMLQGLLQGSEALRIARVSDAELRGKLGELGSRLQGVPAGGERRSSATMQRLVDRQARDARPVQRQRDAAAAPPSSWPTTYERRLEAARTCNCDRRWRRVSLLALAVLLLIGKVYLDDSRRRARATASGENKRNQEAILRLLNEMGNLADGDLTVRAKVTEDITGAIADSINYTIDELRTPGGAASPTRRSR